MALIYELTRLAKSGLKAQQSAQRDWSPYLVHFTRYTAMQAVWKIIKRNAQFSAKVVRDALGVADNASWDSVEQIFKSSSPFLQKHSPQEKEQLPECVCLSQCTLPGLFGHSERFGRFGFVFDKLDIYDLGGRPCAYLGADTYGWLDARHDSEAEVNAMWRNSNVYRPAGRGHVQDFTAEREWRVFDNIPLQGHLRAVIAPDSYATRLRTLLSLHNLNVPILPIDMLYDWGV